MKTNTYVKACLDRLVPELTGLVITGGIVDESGEYWGFSVKGMKDGCIVSKTVFVLSDPEGNGPSFLEIVS